MKIFIAGATGAVGRPLVQLLLSSGHDVVGMTRSPDRAHLLETLGAQPAIADAFDTQAVNRVIHQAQPDVVIDQLTDLPQRLRLRGLSQMYRRQNKLRTHGSAELIEAARAAVVRQVISQSIAFIYAPSGAGLKTEEAPIWRDAPKLSGRALSIAADHDDEVISSTDFTGVVLRYGVLYGPGTHFAPGNGVYEDAKRRRLPIIGDGAGVWSFIHVEDAAQATLAALRSKASGIYNIVDDEPATYREWVPYFANLLGAKPPLKIPRPLGRIIAGPAITAWATDRPGATNEKAKTELHWHPERPSWRQGFREILPQ